MVVDRMTILYCLKRNLVRIKNNNNQEAYDELSELADLVSREGVCN
jgi:hypothetical protein